MRRAFWPRLCESSKKFIISFRIETSSFSSTDGISVEYSYSIKQPSHREHRFQCNQSCGLDIHAKRRKWNIIYKYTALQIYKDFFIDRCDATRCLWNCESSIHTIIRFTAKSNRNKFPTPELNRGLLLLLLFTMNWWTFNECVTNT